MYTITLAYIWYIRTCTTVELTSYNKLSKLIADSMPGPNCFLLSKIIVYLQLPNSGHL